MQIISGNISIVEAEIELAENYQEILINQVSKLMKLFQILMIALNILLIIMWT